MVYDPSAEWTASNAEQNKDVRYILRLDGLASVQFATGTIQNESRATRYDLESLSGLLSQSADPITGHHQAGAFSFTMTDADGYWTNLLSTEQASPQLSSIYNRRVTVLSGYALDDESTYGVIGIGKILDVVSAPTRPAYQFATADVR